MNDDCALFLQRLLENTQIICVRRYTAMLLCIWKLFNGRIVNYFKDQTHRKGEEKPVDNRWETWAGRVSERHRPLWGVLSQAVNQTRRRLGAQPDTRIVDKTHNRSTYDGFFEFWKMDQTRFVWHVNARFVSLPVLQRNLFLYALSDLNSRNFEPLLTLARFVQGFCTLHPESAFQRYSFTVIFPG